MAVELLPESQWRGASANLPQADAESTTGSPEEEDGEDDEGGHIAQVLDPYTIMGTLRQFTCTAFSPHGMMLSQC